MQAGSSPRGRRSGTVRHPGRAERTLRPRATVLPVERLDLMSIGDEVNIHDGLIYTETEVSVRGEFVYGTLVIIAL